MKTLRRISLTIFLTLALAATSSAQDRYLRLTDQDWTRIEGKIENLNRHDVAAVQRLRDEIGRAWAKFERVEDKNSAESKASFAKGKALESALEARMNPASSPAPGSSAPAPAAAETKSADAMVAQVNLLMSEIRMNKAEDVCWLYEPYTADRVDEWVSQMKQLRENREANLAFLAEVDEALDLSNREPVFRAYRRWFDEVLERKMGEGLEATAANLERIANWTASLRVLTSNLGDEQYVANMREKIAAGQEAALALKTVQAELLGLAKPTDELLEAESKIASLAEQLEGGVEQQLANARLPKAIDDEALLEIARESLAEAEVEHLGVVVVREKENVKKLSWDTDAWYRVDYDKFVIAAVIQDGDEHWVKHFSLNFYRSREPGLTTNQWQLRPWQDSYNYRILPENIEL